MANKKYKKRRAGFVILLALILLIIVGIFAVKGEINGGKKTGETVKAGETIATLYVNDKSKLDEAAASVKAAFDIASGEPVYKKHVYKIIK